MNARDRFEKMMNFIESRVAPEEEIFGYPSHSDINYELCTRLGVSFRSLNEIFRFLTDMSLTQYVKERKMMCAYKEIIEKGNYSMDDCLEITGYETASSFNKAFRERFGCSPTEAAKAGDRTKYREKLTWDSINSMGDRAQTAPAGPVEQVKFGIDLEALRKYEEAADLQAIYEMHDLDSEVAFLISEKFGISLKEAFDLVDTDEKSEFISSRMDEMPDEFWEAEDYAARITQEDVDAFYLWNELGDTEISEARGIVRELRSRGIENVRGIDPYYLELNRETLVELPLILDIRHLYKDDERFKRIGLGALVEYARDYDVYEAEGLLDEFCEWEAEMNEL